METGWSGHYKYDSSCISGCKGEPESVLKTRKDKLSPYEKELCDALELQGCAKHELACNKQQQIPGKHKC